MTSFQSWESTWEIKYCLSLYTSACNWAQASSSAVEAFPADPRRQLCSSDAAPDAAALRGPPERPGAPQVSSGETPSCPTEEGPLQAREGRHPGLLVRPGHSQQALPAPWPCHPGQACNPRLVSDGNWQRGGHQDKYSRAFLRSSGSSGDVVQGEGLEAFREEQKL